MPLECGTRLGPYEVTSLLGKGGMGEVYRARDTRLDRVVAVKVLRSDLSANADLRRRFEREARAVSSLNHPHICALYDMGQEEGLDFLILEHLEGETLADRLKRGALPLEQALRHAIEITAALDSAHRCGVVHRDLKPGNIMLTKFGAKLLDFGLARLKPGGSGPSPSEHSAMPTETLEPPLTAEASVVGTVPYMAPELIEGQEADARTDVFSAGVVLYEMTTGRRPFEGRSSAAVMAAILKTEPPPMSRIRSDVPRALDHVVEQCLRKSPNDRWQSAHDIALELGWVQESMLFPEADSAAQARAPRRGWLGWIAAAATGLVALAIGLLLIFSPRALAPQEVIRFSLDAPKGTTVEEPYWSHPRISPDGRIVAFTAFTEGTRSLWIRPLDALSASLLPGTEGALAPFWSPDGRSIAFFAEGKLKTVPANGGAPHSLCDVAAVAASGSWSRAGTIVFGIAEAPGQDGLYRVSASGGVPSRIRLHGTAGEMAYAFYPHFLPDGNRFLFLGLPPNGEEGELYLASLDAEEVERLPHGRMSSRVEYALPGYLLAIAENTLLAQRFDAGKRRLEGSPIPVAENVGEFAYGAAFSVSDNGVLVYRPKGGTDSLLVWFDRAGHKLGSVGAPADHSDLRLSPDGQRLAFAVDDPRTGNSDLWVIRFPEGTPTRLTSEIDDEFSPAWSPDGREIAFSRSRDGAPHVFRMRVGDSAAELLVPHNGHVQWVCDWSPDGRSLLYIDRDPNTWMDLWSLNLDGDRKPVPWLQTRFKEIDAQFSPNGRWVAYSSDDTGRYEVYIRPFQGAGEKRRISSSGGRLPRWRGDGKEIFYLDLASEPGLVSVSLDPSNAELTDTPRTLFQLGAPIREYDVTKDGGRFLINYTADADANILAHVVVNWTAGIPP